MGLPRLRDVPDDFQIPYPVSDKDFVHIIVAMRIFLPDLGLVLSTRESPALRDSLAPLGITQMSAESKTEPGGYLKPGRAKNQFLVSDHGSPREMATALTVLGFDPVFKDWDRAFVGGDE